ARAGLAVARDSGSPYYQTAAVTVIGAALHGLGRYEEAAQHREQAYDLARRVGDRRGIMQALPGLATDEHRLARSEAGLAHVREALDMAVNTGSRLYEGEALTRLAGILMDRDETAEAADLARTALRVAEDTGHWRTRVRAEALLAQLPQSADLGRR